MTFHELVVFYAVLAAFWLCVGKFGEWCIYAAAACALYAWVAGSTFSIGAIYGIFVVYIFFKGAARIFSRPINVFVVNDRDRDRE